MQATADLLAVDVCFTFELAFFYTLCTRQNFLEFAVKDSITTYLLITWDHFCSGVCVVAVQRSQVPITILCIQSYNNCRKTALQRFAEAVFKRANMPAAQLAPLLALTSLPVNYSLSVGSKPEHLTLLLWKVDHSPFPDFLWVDLWCVQICFFSGAVMCLSRVDSEVFHFLLRCVTDDDN